MPKKNSTHQVKVVKWLTMMRESGELNAPVHKMNLGNWYKAYQHAHRGNTTALFNDEKYFNLQMGKIASLHLVGGLHKIIQRNPRETFYELTTF